MHIVYADICVRGRASRLRSAPHVSAYTCQSLCKLRRQLASKNVQKLSYMLYFVRRLKKGKVISGCSIRNIELSLSTKLWLIDGLTFLGNF